MTCCDTPASPEPTDNDAPATGDAPRDTHRAADTHSSGVTGDSTRHGCILKGEFALFHLGVRLLRSLHAQSAVARQRVRRGNASDARSSSWRTVCLAVAPRASPVRRVHVSAAGTERHTAVVIKSFISNICARRY